VWKLNRERRPVRDVRMFLENRKGTWHDWNVP
jgi:hypothetical protein